LNRSKDRTDETNGWSITRIRAVSCAAAWRWCHISSRRFTKGPWRWRRWAVD